MSLAIRPTTPDVRAVCAWLITVLVSCVQLSCRLFKGLMARAKKKPIAPVKKKLSVRASLGKLAKCIHTASIARWGSPA